MGTKSMYREHIERLNQRINLAFGTIRSRIVSSGMYHSITTYIATRRLNAFLFLASLIGILFLLAIFSRIYTYEEPQTRITIVPFAGYKIERASLRFVYLGSENSIMEIVLKVTSLDGKLAGKQLMLYISENLRPKDFSHSDFDFKSIERFRFDTGSFHGFKHVYEFTRDTATATATAMLFDEFSGNLFGNSESELSFNLYVASAAQQDFPISVSIGGLEGASIGNMFPEPKSRIGNYLVYEFNSNTANVSAPDISINAIDRRALYTGQSKLVIMGALLAILMSVLVNILTDFTSQSSRV